MQAADLMAFPTSLVGQGAKDNSPKIEELAQSGEEVVSSNYKVVETVDGTQMILSELAVEDPAEVSLPDDFKAKLSFIKQAVGKPDANFSGSLLFDNLTSSEIIQLNRLGYSVHSNEKGQLLVTGSAFDLKALPEGFQAGFVPNKVEKLKHMAWARNLASRVKAINEAEYKDEERTGLRAAVINIAGYEKRLLKFSISTTVPLIGKLTEKSRLMSQYGHYQKYGIGKFVWDSYTDRKIIEENGIKKYVEEKHDLSDSNDPRVVGMQMELCKRAGVPFTGERKAVFDESTQNYEFVKNSRWDRVKSILSDKRMMTEIAYTGARTGAYFGVMLSQTAQTVGRLASPTMQKLGENSVVSQLANSNIVFNIVDATLAPAYSIVRAVKEKSLNSFAAVIPAALSTIPGFIIAQKLSMVGFENAMEHGVNPLARWFERAVPRMTIRGTFSGMGYATMMFFGDRYISLAESEEERSNRSAKVMNFMLQYSAWCSTLNVFNRAMNELGTYDKFTGGSVKDIAQKVMMEKRIEMISSERGISKDAAEKLLIEQMTNTNQGVHPQPVQTTEEIRQASPLEMAVVAGSGGKGASALKVETPAETIIGAVNNAKQNTNTRGPGTFFNRMTEVIKGNGGNPEMPGRSGGVNINFTDKDWLDGGKERQAAIPVAEGLIKEMRSDPEKFITDYNLSGQVSAAQLQNQTTQESIALAMSARVIQGHSGSSLYNDLIKTAPDASQVDKILAGFREDLRLGTDNKILEEPINLNLQKSSTGELIAGSNRYTGAIGKFSYSSPIPPPVATSGTGGTGGHVTPPAPSGVEIHISRDVANSLQNQGLIDSDNIIEIVKVAGGNEQIRIVDSTGKETLLPFSQVSVNGTFQPMSSTGTPVTTSDILDVNGILISKSSGEQVGFKGTGDEIYWYAQSGSNDFLVKQSDLLDGNNIVTSYDRNNPTNELELKYHFTSNNYVQIDRLINANFVLDGINNSESDLLKEQIIAYGTPKTYNGTTYTSVSIGGTNYLFDPNIVSNPTLSISDFKAIEVGGNVIPRSNNTFLTDQLVFANSKINAETDVVIVGAGGAQFANIITSDKDGGLFVEINGDYFDSNLSTSPRPTVTDGTGTYIEYSGNLFLIKEGKFEVKGNLTENGFEIKDGALQRVSTPTPAAPTSEPTEAATQEPTALTPTATTPAPTVQATTPVPTTEPVTQAPTNTLTPVPSNTATQPATSTIPPTVTLAATSQNTVGPTIESTAGNTGQPIIGTVLPTSTQNSSVTPLPTNTQTSTVTSIPTIQPSTTPTASNTPITPTVNPTTPVPPTSTLTSSPTPIEVAQGVNNQQPRNQPALNLPQVLEKSSHLETRYIINNGIDLKVNDSNGDRLYLVGDKVYDLKGNLQDIQVIRSADNKVDLLVIGSGNDMKIFSPTSQTVSSIWEYSQGQGFIGSHQEGNTLVQDLGLTESDIVVLNSFTKNIDINLDSNQNDTLRWLMDLNSTFATKDNPNPIFGTNGLGVEGISYLNDIYGADGNLTQIELIQALQIAEKGDIRLNQIDQPITSGPWAEVMDLLKEKNLLVSQEYKDIVKNENLTFEDLILLNKFISDEGVRYEIGTFFYDILGKGNEANFENWYLQTYSDGEVLIDPYLILDRVPSNRVHDFFSTSQAKGDFGDLGRVLVNPLVEFLIPVILSGTALAIASEHGYTVDPKNIFNRSKKIVSNNVSKLTRSPKTVVKNVKKAGSSIRPNRGKGSTTNGNAAQDFLNNLFK